MKWFSGPGYSGEGSKDSLGMNLTGLVDGLNMQFESKYQR